MFEPMATDRDVAPIFVVGAPRSGTSLLYKALCLHPETAYVSNYVHRFPRWPALGMLNRVARRFPLVQRRVWFGSDSNAYVYGRRRSLVERIVPMPAEGEPVYALCGIREGVSSPADSSAGEAQALRGAMASVRRYSGGSVLVLKRIANNRRIPFLRSAFPAARFVNITRDGRAVAYSLSRVDWWDELPIWWWGGRRPAEWEAAGNDPWALCARHWVEEVEAAEAGLSDVPPSQVFQLTYEELTDGPREVLDKVASFAGLPSSPQWNDDLGSLSYPNKNESWRERLEPASVQTIESVQGGHLSQRGYELVS